jgi:hypothetical protein
LNVNLIQDEINCYEPVLHTVLNREETLEMIVPDACPDILEVIDTDAAVQLRSKDCADGCITLQGGVLCSVLYTPEEGSGLQRLSAELPFQFTAELEQLTAQSRCCIIPQVTLAETRAMNPRKVLIRVNMTFELTAYQPSCLRYCTDMGEREPLGLEQRTQQHKGSFVVHVSERPFTYTDEIQIPGSKPPMQEVLRLRSRAFTSETRLIGGKLVFKGGTAIHLLYLSREGQICTADFELPFSQVADVGNVAEDADFQLDIAVSGCQFSQNDPEGRDLELELELVAQVVIRENRELSVVTDAYSIYYPGVPEFSTYLLPQLLENSTRRQTARELLETVSMAQSVCDVRAMIGQVRTNSNELSVDLRVAVLYRTEQSGYAQVTRQVTVRCPLELEEDISCLASCTVPELDAAAVAGGIEVRMGVDFQILLLRQNRLYGLTSFGLDTDQRATLENQPSIVLRQMTAGETLWDIAKAYLTTQTEIEQANGLSGDKEGEGQMLLIPRKR